ncbi:MAG: CheR family methyltransferase, partial [Acidiferrobacterales bacterium]
DGTAVRWELHDIRTTLPTGHFDLILCRNLVFTYFDDQLQDDILARLLAILEPGGVLVVGKHESLPVSGENLVEWFPRLGIYRKQ